MPSIINATTSTGLVTTADNSGSLQLATNNGTTALAITTGQNVGLGTTTPSSKLQINVAAGVTGLNITDANTSDFQVAPAVTSGVCRVGPTAGAMAFYTNDTERMRLTSDGTLRQTLNPVLFNIDASPCTATIANGSSINFGTSYSGAIFATDTSSSGQTALLMCGGGSTSTTGGGGQFTNTSGSGNIRFYNSGAGYVLQNNSGSTITFGLFVVRTRAGT